MPLVFLCLLGMVWGSVFCAPAALAWVDPSSGEPTPRRVLRPFDKPAQNWLPGHRGVDLDLEMGGDVRAAEDGIVDFVGVVAGTRTIAIAHPDGLRSTYSPVFATVERGEFVAEGQVIGRLAPPFDGYPGLHWGVLQGKDDYLNPLSLLATPVIRLKPVDGPGYTAP